jgi:hypothetical protein
MGLMLNLDAFPGFFTWIGYGVAIVGWVLIGRAKLIEENQLKAIENINYTKLLRDVEMEAK